MLVLSTAIFLIDSANCNTWYLGNLGTADIAGSVSWFQLVLVGCTMNPVTFRKVNKDDFPQVLAIQEENLISNRNSLKTGFLVNPITEQDFSDPDAHTYVAVDDDQVVGYFSGKKFVEGSHFDDKFLNDQDTLFYWKHICLKENYKGSGIIKEFENYCFGEIRKVGFTALFAEISLKPLNTRSFNFHTNVQNLQQLYEYSDRKGFVWGVFIKEL